MQTEAQENKIQEKDNEVLRLLNQIATDMIRKSDVDRLIEEAVNKATSALKAEYEDRMKAMAAEYEAKIAEIQNRKEDDKGNGKDQTPGKSTKNARKKGNSIICGTKEEAMQRLQEEMNKAAIMQDQAFGKGSEKLSSEQKAAIDPINGDADDDSQVKAAVSPCGDYGLCEYDPKARSNEYSNYIKVDAEDESLVDCYPVGCNKESKEYATRDNVVWELSLPRLKKIICRLYQCKLDGKKVWGKMPNTDSLLKGTHVGTMYVVNLILNKYLNGMAENRTRKSLNYMLGLDIPKQTNNTIVNNMLTKVRKLFEPTYRSHILKDPYLAAGKCGELLLKAINYAMAEWKGLIRYTMDGRYRADNNYAEQCMRDLACGRKNFLFCGSDNAAMNLSFAYSLTESCKYNNINPYDYWSDLIENVGKEGVDLNSFVHNLWQKHNK